MFSIVNRRWFYPAIFALTLFAEFFVSRATWRTDTQGDTKLHRLQVRSGYELLVENPASKNAQPILSYNPTSEHNHRLTVDILNGRPSDESLRLLAPVNPPKTSGRLIYAPDPNEPKTSGPSCLIAFSVEFPVATDARVRAAQIAPPKPDDFLDRSTTRLVHLASSSPLPVRLSANSNGTPSPGCRHLLSIGTWQQVVGKDLELAFYPIRAPPSISPCPRRRTKTVSCLSTSGSRMPVFTYGLTAISSVAATTGRQKFATRC
jgi:hypothetical protein